MFLQIMLGFCVAFVVTALVPGILSSSVMLGYERKYVFLHDFIANIFAIVILSLVFYIVKYFVDLSEKELGIIVFTVTFSLSLSSISDFQKSL